jgi:RHS repeat-associated protein
VPCSSRLYRDERVFGIQNVNEGGTNNLLAQYGWDALSRTQSIAYGDGTSDAYSQYDAGDNLQTLTQTYNGSNSSVTFNNTWLMNHQLNSAGVNNPLFQYAPQAGTVSYGAANADNGLTTESSSTSSATMTYDGNYNLTYDGTNTLSYDVENRLIQAVNPVSGTSSYLYDPLGHRKQKVVGVNTVMPVATDFVLAGGEEIADYYEASATWRLTVRGAGGLPLVTVVPAGGDGSKEIVYVHHDMKGSTVALTVPGSSGPAETYTYSDYGAPQSGSWLAYQYAGYRYDSETGLYSMPARSYSPALGRFLQSDPAGFQGGFNLYAYAGNDPVNLIDPTGLTPDGGGRAWTVTAEASATVNNYFMGVLGIPTVDVAAKSMCSAIPAGKTTGVSGGLGGIGSVGGGMEMVVNYSSGQVSGFYFGGGQLGWNGGASGSVYNGYIYGLNNSNSNYGGGFTGFNGAYGVGVFGASTSGGLTSGVGGLAPDGVVTVGGVGIGAGLMGGFSGGATATNYTEPIQGGSFWAFDVSDWALYAAKQMCKAAGF